MNLLEHWPERVLTMQRNWIGRSEGAEVVFRVEETEIDLPVFTTRPDTLFGATFFVMAPEHPLVSELVAGSPEEQAVRAYVKQAQTRSNIEREEKEKDGVFTGRHVINPVNGEPIPVWIADYVLMEYGTGAIMAVPGHDDRDFEFAMVFGLPITRVVCKEGDDPSSDFSSAFTGYEGTLVNSGQFDGMTVEEGKRAIVEMLSKQGRAKSVVNYRLHDWCISRQ